MISLRLYDRDGTTALGLLAEPVGFQISVEFSDLGALQFEYPINGVNASQIEIMREIAITNENGTEFSNARYVISNINRDRLASTGTITVSARSLLWRFETALAYPDGGVLSGEVKRTFQTATAGTIIKTLIDDAKNRGALTGIGYSFSNSSDSNSMGWSDTTDSEYTARSTILSVIRQLAELGLVEVQMNGRVLKATRPEGIGSDLTITANPIVLRDGFNLTQAPEEINADKLAAVALVEADEGQLLERSNSSTLATYGRLETSFTASGIDDPVVINDLSDSYLTNVATPKRQLTVGLTMQSGAPQPLKDFTVGDYVYTATSVGLERVRVRQVTITMSNGSLSATATLGDRIFENEIRQTRRLAAITSGSVNIGNGSEPSSTPVVELTPDTIPPAPPTALTGTSTFYLEGSNPRARVLLTWTAPTLNEDGSPMIDLGGYEVNLRRSASDAWEFSGVVSNPTATLSGLEPSKSYQFKVIAVDAYNNRSTDSNIFTHTTATQTVFSTTPSTPTATSRLGTVSITWNGLSNLGGSMPVDFSYVNVHASTTNNFTPTTSTIVGRMNGAETFVKTDLTYGVAYFFKLVGYSTSGIASTASGEATATVTPLVNTDLIGKVLSSANFQEGSVDTAALASGAVNAAKLVDGAVIASKILDGAIDSLKLADSAVSAAKIATGAVGSNQISAGAIVAGKIAAGAITSEKIESGAITSAKITAGAIGATEIAAGAITAAKISAGAIGATEIAANAIVAGKIAADAVTAGTIAALAIEAGKIAANAITADKIEAGAITTVKLAATAITAEKIAADAVTAAKISSTAIDGKTITGATIRTSANTARVEMTSSGLFVYNSSGTAVVSLNASGTASFTGTVNATSGTFSGTVNAGSGYLGSASTGWNFSSMGYLYNNGSTTILYPTGNAYALITDKGVSAADGYQAKLGCVFDVGGSTTSNSYWKSNARIIPGTDNSFSLGASSFLWSVVYAKTGTINTSDIRAKTEITPSVLGLDFIKSLNPVSYKFKVGGNQVDKETGEVTAIPGARTHFGLLAQEVKASLDELAPGQDFSGWVLMDMDDPDSYQGLRYDSFIAPMIKAIQELSAKVKALEESNG